MAAYFKVEQDKPTCPNCGNGGEYTVVDPAGTDIVGQSFGGPDTPQTAIDAAEDLAEAMNRAFVAGFNEGHRAAKTVPDVSPEQFLRDSESLGWDR